MSSFRFHEVNLELAPYHFPPPICRRQRSGTDNVCVHCDCTVYNVHSKHVTGGGGGGGIMLIGCQEGGNRMFGLRGVRGVVGVLLKGEVSRYFRPLFFSLIEPIWVPNKQAKMVFLKNSFSRRD